MTQTIKSAWSNVANATTPAGTPATVHKNWLVGRGVSAVNIAAGALQAAEDQPGLVTALGLQNTGSNWCRWLIPGATRWRLIQQDANYFWDSTTHGTGAPFTVLLEGDVTPEGRLTGLPDTALLDYFHGVSSGTPAPAAVAKSRAYVLQLGGPGDWKALDNPYDGDPYTPLSLPLQCNVPGVNDGPDPYA